MRRPRLPALLLAVPLLGIARLLPEHGVGLWVRLAAATLVLLLPGQLVSRALGGRGAGAALTWSVALVAGPLALTFALGASLSLTLALVLAAGALALPFALRRLEPAPRGRRTIALAGVGLGAALWGIEGVIHGDALFHLGRIRKLDDFGSLSLRAVDEFKDGGLHPGYAFPLWHAWLALVARLAGVDPSAVVLHESSLLAPLALLVAFEVGVAVFRSVSLGLAAMLAQVALIALAPGDGGAYTTLELPGTTARQLLVPAATVAFFGFVRRPSWPLALTLAAAGLDLAFVHPTYALFLAIPLAGFVLARALVARTDVRRGIGGLAAFGAPILLAFAWLEPIVAETRSHDPTGADKAQGLAHYASDLVVHTQSSYHLAPEVVARSGSVAVAALVLVPLAGLAARRRWSALVLGGTVIVLAIELSGLLFPRFSDLVSLSQSRRAAGFVPFAVALVGGAAVLARGSRLLLLPVALAAGIALQLAFPGDFGLSIESGGPAAATWIALAGGVISLAGAAALARRRRVGGFERPGPAVALATFLFVLPVAVHGFAHWDTQVPSDSSALTPGLVGFLRHDVPHRTVVFADLATSYRISAYAPVYVTNGPPAHVANTKANRPAERRADAKRFFEQTASLAIPRAYGASYIVLRKREPVRALRRDGLPLVYRDESFVVFRLPAEP